MKITRIKKRFTSCSRIGIFIVNTMSLMLFIYFFYSKKKKGGGKESGKNVCCFKKQTMQVISCRISTDLNKKIDLEHDINSVSVSFTYTVDWEETEVDVNDRLSYHMRKLIRSQPLDVHWLSILNSFILVVLVTAFVALVMTRVLRRDCARYRSSAAFKADLEDVDDSGWKQLQQDVFRVPNRIMLFSACIGTGM
ncbi:hypothetical protein RFI_07675 [Reticulomyxa filosa]|uniref:Transmembrane 9 superfamily member n=1 Tax=Reticulomyxa filosa TaxID=46433 RepID=X6NU52_RETFI|nr:hypothetical protein RFI_07675 [Reticulomyxa filosa]|eukprot:ETO29448.1 hypothetical protein RFI_07675 [Reticulomyxa filosa]